jgi:hypothetical protein
MVIFCLPVISKSQLAELVIADIKYPEDNISKAKTPALNALPNIPSMKDGMRKIINKTGKDVQKTVFVDI